VTVPPSTDHWEAELRALREELRELRAEQREMAQAINQLVTTFRSLATHLGIAAEPYVRKGDRGSQRDLPGFA
jgi:chromosome segregation ATPase